MKKLLSLALAMALSCSMLLTGCGGKEEPAPAPSEPSDPGTSESTDVNWPAQPVNIMCPASAGGGTDLMLRTWNEYFTAKTGQPFVITNIAGVSGYEQTYQATLTAITLSAAPLPSSPVSWTAPSTMTGMTMRWSLLPPETSLP